MWQGWQLWHFSLTRACTHTLGEALAAEAGVQTRGPALGALGTMLGRRWPAEQLLLSGRELPFLGLG